MKVSELNAGARVIYPGRNAAPKISIITPTYCRNLEGLLMKCLDSAVIQSFADYEHIIIDDGSSDGTEDTVREFALRDDRIVYVRHSRNSGLPAVRANEGILRSRGEAVAFLFDDNVFEPNFLKSAWLALWESNADAIVTLVKMFYDDASSSIARRSSFLIGGWPQTTELLRNLNTIPNGGVLIRRSFFDRFGLYDPHLIMRRACDWDLWLRALKLGARFHSLDEVGAVERGLVSPNSIGNTIAWDAKIVYAYMQDETRHRERVARLLPSTVEDFDVLDPSAMLPYVRDGLEWRQVLERIYKPYLNRHHSEDFEAASINAAAGAFKPKEDSTPASAPQRRRRTLVVSNAINAFASAWLDALRSFPNEIVVNCTEIQLGSFPPHEFDLLVLMDCCQPYSVRHVEAFRKNGIPIVYIYAYAQQDVATEIASFTKRKFNNNIHVLQRADGMYFPQSGSCPQPNELLAAKAISALSTILLTDAASKELFAEAQIWPAPSSGEKGWGDVQVDGERKVIGFDLPPGNCAVDERIGPPRSVADAANMGGVDNELCRPTWESLAAVLETRPDATIVIPPDLAENLPSADRFGIVYLSARNNVRVVRSDTMRPLLASNADALRQWIKQIVTSVFRARASSGEVTASSGRK